MITEQSSKHVWDLQPTAILNSKKHSLKKEKFCVSIENGLYVSDLSLTAQF